MSGGTSSKTPRWQSGLRPVIVGLSVMLVWAGLLWFLLSRPGRPYLSENLIFQRPNVSKAASARPRLVLQPDGRRVWSLFIETKPGFPLTEALSLGFPIDVSPGEPRHNGLRYRTFGTVTAELRSVDGRIWFRTPGEVLLRDESLLELYRANPGPPVTWTGNPTNLPARLELRLSTAAPENISFWAHAVSKGWVGSASFPLGWLRVGGNGQASNGGEEHYLTGHLTRSFTEPVLRRIDLLRFLWGRQVANPDVLHVLFLSAIALGLAGGLITGLRTVDARPWRQAFAAALAIGGFGAAQASLHAPFSPPDEPDHALSYAAHIKDSQLPAALLKLAQDDHSERVRARVYEHFCAADMTQSSTANWSEHINTTPLRMSERSPATCSFWNLTRFLVRGASAGETVFRLRLLAVLTVALAGGVAAYWLTAGHTTGPLAAWWPLLFAPGIPFFGMQVSNYFLLISSQIVIAGLLAWPWKDGHSDRWRGLMLGAAIGLCLVASRAAIPVAAAAGVILAMRATRSRNGKSLAAGCRQAACFWILLGSGLLALSARSLPEYDMAARQNWRSIITEAAPTWLAELTFWRGVVLVVSCGAAIEVLGGCVLANAVGCEGEAPAWQRRLTRSLTLIGAAALLILPLFGAMPDFQGLSAHTSAGPFVASAISSMLTSYGFFHHDYFLAETFWRACGYNEAIGPRILVGIACFLVVSGWSLRFWLTATRPDKFGHALVTFLACAGYLTALAIGGWQSKHGLNGRYLVGFYVFLLVGSGVGWTMFTASLSERAAGLARPLWLLPLLVHGAHLCALVERQF